MEKRKQHTSNSPPLKRIKKTARVLLLAGLLTGPGTALVFQVVLAVREVLERSDIWPGDTLWKYISDIGVYFAFFPSLLLLPLLTAVLMSIILVAQEFIDATYQITPHTSHRSLVYAGVASLLNVSLVAVVRTLFSSPGINSSIFSKIDAQMIVNMPYGDGRVYIVTLLFVSGLIYYLIFKQLFESSDEHLARRKQRYD